MSRLLHLVLFFLCIAPLSLDAQSSSADLALLEDTRGSVSSPSFQSPTQLSWTLSVLNAEVLNVDLSIAMKKYVEPRRRITTEDTVVRENFDKQADIRYVGTNTFKIAEYVAYTRIRIVGITLNAYAPGAVRFTWTVNCTTGFEETIYRRCVSKTPCAAGFYLSDQDYKSCLPCPPGTYSNVTGARFPLSCKRCPAGTSTPDPASTSCAPCPNGTFTDPQAPYGTYACTGCPRGSYQDGSLGAAFDSSVCVACPAGKISTMLSSPECAMCAAGTYQVRTL